MLTRLPAWVWRGVWLLAFIAGMVNVVGLLSFDHRPVTHLTGTTSLLAEAIGSGNRDGVLHILGVLVSFLAGTVLSDVIVRDHTLQLGRRYGVALFLESMLLAAAVPLLDRASLLGIYAASCACGLQNAMVTAYSGSVIRTTHVSGMFTDLGISVGHRLRGLPVDERRIRLSLIVISGFVAGGIATTLAYPRLGTHTLFIPSGLTAASAVTYWAYLYNKRRGTGESAPTPT